MKDRDGASSTIEQLDSLPGGTERLLFIDDEEVIANIEAMTLRFLGYDVTVANSGAAALGIFSSQPDAFDLVITDQSMPELTGSELARQLLKNWPAIPVILCTGHYLRPDDEACRAPNIRACLMKPVSRRDLASTIRRVLDGG